MKVSLICPTYNEEGSVTSLIESMLNQTKKPGEIIFVDSFSKDNTAKIIEKYSKKYKSVKLIQEKSNISEARNIAIRNAKNEIIACTDASSKLKQNWLEEITKPFEDKKIDVVSGGYVAISKGGIEDYIAMITIKPMEEWNEKTFLPSGRSVAFKKKAWKEVGEFPENLYTGEDTLFMLLLKERGFKFKLAKKAIVYWRGRNTLRKFIKQYWLYGKGDGEAGNLRRMKTNLIFFLGLNAWLAGVVVFFFVYSVIGWILVALMVAYLELYGIKFSTKKKRIGALVVIPFLMFFKRFSYFFGVWRGLFSKN